MNITQNKGLVSGRPDGTSQLYDEYIGQEVVLGIRPEHIQPGEGPGSFCAEVTLREMMGAESYLPLKATGDKMVCRVPETADSGSSEETLSILFNQKRVLLFDKDSGERI